MVTLVDDLNFLGEDFHWRHGAASRLCLKSTHFLGPACIWRVHLGQDSFLQVVDFASMSLNDIPSAYRSNQNSYCPDLVSDPFLDYDVEEGRQFWGRSRDKLHHRYLLSIIIAASVV